MNYPLQSLTIIAPILFIVLMAGIPVIGVFAGWKRAAYWGGGTFLFYIIGLIIWIAAGHQIATTFTPLFNSLLPKDKFQLDDRVVKSIIAPGFLIIVMAIGELILLINYYTWFKKVSKIKEDIQIKKAYKLAKKEGRKSFPKGVKSASGWGKMQLTSKGKAINMACGGVGMALLMFPTTVSFTQGVAYYTTTSSTRQTMGFANTLYNQLERLTSTFSWMSYYGKAETGKDADSLFNLLNWNNTTIGYSYVAWNEGTQSFETKTVTVDQAKEKNQTIVDAVSTVISGGFDVIIKQVSKDVQSTTPDITQAEGAIKAFANTWNSFYSENATSVNAVFGSDGVNNLIKEQFVGTLAASFDDDMVESWFGEDSIFNQILTDYQSESFSPKVTPIPVSQESFNSLFNGIMKTIDVSGIKKQENIDQFNKRFAEVASILFQVV